MKLSNILLVLFNIISILFKSNAFSMKMIRIDSPQLNIFPQSLSIKEKHQALVNLSLSRSHYAQKNPSKKITPNAIAPPLSSLNSYYATELTFGTGNTSYTRRLVLDTFVNQTWIQCDGCDPCFKLKDGNVRAEDSPTYARMTLDDLRCDPKLNFDAGCGFEDWFGGGYTEGYVGTETFVITDSHNEQIFFPNVAFGCGIHNKDFPFKDDNNNLAGVHGLSDGPKSFLTQLSNQVRGRFSYCLKPDGGQTTMSFGDDAQISGETQTIAMNPDGRYHLYLNGISLDGIRLPIDPSVFKLDEENFSKGFFTDPSTPFTVLDSSAYNVLRLAIIAHFAISRIAPTPGLVHGSDLCFAVIPEVSGPVEYPPITFHFIKSLKDGGEVDLEFEREKVFEEKLLGLTFCLMMLGTSDGPSIFGAYQQAGSRYLFDVKGATLSYAPDKC